MKTLLASRIGNALLAALVLAVPSIGFAQEVTLIAGWDFSQYTNQDYLSLDSATLTGNRLDANHSDLDPTAQCGIESNAFGRMYFDGSFGSSPAVLDPTFLELDAFRPFPASETSGSLLSNVDQAFLGYGSVAACIQEQIESMPYANCQDFAMIATDPVSIVFAADRSTAPTATGEWTVSFAGRTLFEGSTQVNVQFSPNGSSYTNAGIADVTGADAKFRIGLGDSASPTAYVRLVFPAPSEGAEVLIDNLGISVPEPSGAAVAATITLAALVRARRRG